MFSGSRIRLVLIAALVATASPVAFGATAACAGEGARAALVVDTGNSVQTFCVSLPDGQTSGLGLIALANEQHGLAYKFGFGGEAVCMLAGVGPTSDDCFEQYPNFWGYWRGDGSGGWAWSGSGAGSTTVTDGDVEGWSWGSGSDGESHPRPPETTFGDVCAAQAEKPPVTRKPRPRDEDPAPSGSGGGGQARPRRPAPGPTAAVTGDRPAPDPGRKRTGGKGEGPKKSRRPKARKSDDKTAALAPTAPASPTALDEQPAAALEPTEQSGPPAAGLAALGVAALLGGAGFVISRRRPPKV